MKKNYNSKQKKSYKRQKWTTMNNLLRTKFQALSNYAVIESLIMLSVTDLSMDRFVKDEQPVRTVADNN